MINADKNSVTVSNWALATVARQVKLTACQTTKTGSSR